MKKAKECSECGEVKDAQEDFYARGNRCKECVRAYQNARYHATKTLKPPPPPPGPTKVCPQCNQTKDRLNDFYFDKKRGKEGSWCKKCHVAASKKRYRKERPERLKAARNYWLLDQYGITAEEYEILWKQQDGKCALCRAPEKSKRRLHTDHCHETGKIRGLLCPGCNSALGKLGDTSEAFERVLDYLRGECLTKSL